MLEFVSVRAKRTMGNKVININDLIKAEMTFPFAWKVIVFSIDV